MKFYESLNNYKNFVKKRTAFLRSVTQKTEMKEKTRNTDGKPKNRIASREIYTDNPYVKNEISFFGGKKIDEWNFMKFHLESFTQDALHQRRDEAMLAQSQLLGTPTATPIIGCLPPYNPIDGVRPPVRYPIKGQLLGFAPNTQ